MPRRQRTRALAAAAALTAGACSGGSTRPSQAAATGWDAKATAAFGPATTALPNLDLGLKQWQAGTITTAALSTAATAAMARLVDVRSRINALPPSPAGPRLVALYRLSVALDLQAAAVAAALPAASPPPPAGDTPPPGAAALAGQLALSAVRLRVLGDRVFDRGHALLAPALPARDPDLEVNLPEEVPMWTAEGLAPGPPLDPAGPSGPPSFDARRRLRQPSRAEQSRSAWRRDVARAAIPPAPSLAAYLAQGSGAPAPSDTGVTLAHGYTASAERLRGEPDPANDREAGARLRLGLLVDAEAALAQRGAELSGTSQGPLHEVARHLAVIGDGLWPPEVGAPRSGLPAGLLSDDR